MLNELETITHLAAGERGIPCNLPLTSLNDETLDIRELDFQTLIPLAHRHKLTNTLLSAIKKLSVSKKLSLTPETQKKLENYKKSAILEKTSRTFMVEEALKICRTLTNSDIPALIIKGPILSLQLYGSPVVREYTDIDIVVDTQDFFRVDKVLQTLGYGADPESQTKQFNHEENMHPFSQKSSFQKSYIQKPHHIVYKNPSHPYRIEIHNQFFNRELFTSSNFSEEYNLQNIFSRSETINYKDSAYTAINKIDHLLFMITHGTKHAWSQLHWVLDAAALLASEDVSLHTDIVEGCVQLQMEKSLVLMITVVTELLPIPIPSAYRKLAAQHQQKLKKQKAIVLKMLRSPNTIQLSILHTLHFTWNYSAPLALNFKEKINISLNPFKASPADIDKLNLPGWLAPLHLMARPIFVLSRKIKRQKELHSTCGPVRHQP